MLGIQATPDRGYICRAPALCREQSAGGSLRIFDRQRSEGQVLKRLYDLVAVTAWRGEGTHWIWPQ
jgi:hypothetical protein